MTIILVEDHDTDAELTQRTLRRAGMAHQIFRCRDGFEVLDLVDNLGPPTSNQPVRWSQLILLSNALPGMPSLTCVQRLRASSKSNDIPIVLMAAHDNTVVVGAFRAYGVLEVLLKPIDAASVRKICASIAGLEW